MDWAEIFGNWGQRIELIRDRFPHVEESALARRCASKRDVISYLAESHQLTLDEAREELEDWLFTLGLSRRL